MRFIIQVLTLLEMASLFIDLSLRNGGCPIYRNDVYSCSPVFSKNEGLTNSKTETGKLFRNDEH